MDTFRGSAYGTSVLDDAVAGALNRCRIKLMPIFEYICSDCREKFEKLVLRRSDDSAVPCPRCGSTHTQQAFSTFATSGSSSEASAGACAPGGRFT